MALRGFDGKTALGSAEGFLNPLSLTKRHERLLKHAPATELHGDATGTIHLQVCAQHHAARAQPQYRKALGRRCRQAHSDGYQRIFPNAVFQPEIQTACADVFNKDVLFPWRAVRVQTPQTCRKRHRHSRTEPSFFVHRVVERKSVDVLSVPKHSRRHHR
jgi:hypothetical protein